MNNRSNSEEEFLVDFSEEFLRSYREYAISVVEDRAIPDLRDGFKPVQRRIVYAMIELLNSNNKFTSSVRIVGETNGKYHPKGNTAIYGALVKMTQTFNLAHPFITGQGNFGSLDGDGPAADRYTLVRLSPLIKEITRFQNIFPEGLNYDLTLPEPPLLPSLFPYTFTTGTSGIAVGIATNTVPFNLQEILDVLIAICQGTTDEDTLLEFIKGPDFPNGGIILDSREVILRTLKNGRGSFRVSSDYEFVQDGVLMTSVPYGVYKDPIIQELSEIVEEKIPEIKEIYDESTKGKIQVRFIFRPTADKEVTLNKLLKFSKFAVAIPYSNVFLFDKKAKTYSLIEGLIELVSYHKSILLQEATFNLIRVRRLLRQQRVIQLTIENIKAIMDLFSNVTNQSDLRQTLYDSYNLEEIDVDFLLGLRLSQLTRFEKQKVEENIERYLEEEKMNERVINDPSFLTLKQIDEYIRIGKTYHLNRRTKVTYINYNKMNLIPLVRNILIRSQQGFIRILPVDYLRTQRRGGLGSNLRMDSEVRQIFEFTSHDTLFIITNRNRIFYISGNLLMMDESERVHFREIFNQQRLGLESDEIVSYIFPVTPEHLQNMSDYSLLFIYQNGSIRRVPLSEYNINQTRGIRVGGRDEMIILSVIVIDNRVPHQFVSMLSSEGRLLTFPLDQVRELNRISQGVMGMRLRTEDETVISATVFSYNEENPGNLLVLTSEGNMRLTPYSNLVFNSRANTGVLLTTVTDANEIIYPVSIAAIPNNPSEHVLLWTNTGRALQVNVSDIRVVSERRGRGVSAIRLESTENVIDISVFRL